MWVSTADLPTSAGHPFFERLNRRSRTGWVRRVRRAVVCSSTRSGWAARVFAVGTILRMLFIRYFEGLSSAHGLASRASDSLSLRSFLDPEVTEAFPHHSTLSPVRRLTNLETHVALSRGFWSSCRGGPAAG